jgi:hypothetical protein
VERLLNEGLQLENQGSIEWPAGYLNAHKYYRAAHQLLPMDIPGVRKENLEKEIHNRRRQIKDKLELSRNHFLARAATFAKVPPEGCEQIQWLMETARKIIDQLRLEPEADQSDALKRIEILERTCSLSIGY